MKVPGQNFHTGDPVRLREDPRHLGLVQAVIQGQVRVKWTETTWISDEDPRDLENLWRQS